LVYSYMSIFENSDNPNKKHLKIIFDFFKNATQFISDAFYLNVNIS